MEPLVILLAFFAGLGFRALGYPPLLGYLLAGFVAHALGLGGDGAGVDVMANLGITLLLFTIGLKLNLKELIAPQVWGTATLQTILVVPLTWGMLTLLAQLLPGLELSAEAGLTLAFALSFSSTVFTTKTLEERGEAVALHAAIAIGILVVQDLFAVGYLVVASGKFPTNYALWLLALPLLRPVLGRILQWVGHGELLILFGFLVALGGSGLFEAVNMKGDLGALLIGMLLNSHKKSSELYKNLIQFKDIFLIGFFLQIGFNGLPGGNMLLVALALGALVLLRPVVYVVLLLWLRQRARTALLAALSLATYSEFGLIVAQLAAKGGTISNEWVTTIALALALSFFIATPLNNRARDIYGRFGDLLLANERGVGSTEEAIATLGQSDIVIVGAGRVGVGAYRYLSEHHPGNVICIEENGDKAAALQAEGINCVHADGNDRDFWDRASLAERKLILVSLTNHKENMSVVKFLKSQEFYGDLAVVSRYPDEEREIREAGCITFNLYAEAGHGFAEHVLEQSSAYASPQR